MNKTQNYYNSKLPIAVKPEDFGNIILKKDNHHVITVNKNTLIILDKDKDTNNVQFYRNGQLLYTWNDKIIDDNSFIREIGKSTYHFTNKELTLVLSKRVIKKLSTNLTYGIPEKDFASFARGVIDFKIKLDQKQIQILND